MKTKLEGEVAKQEKIASPIQGESKIETPKAKKKTKSSLDQDMPPGDLWGSLAV